MTLISKSKSVSYTAPTDRTTSSVIVNINELSSIKGISSVSFSGTEGGANSALRGISISGNKVTLTVYCGYGGGQTVTVTVKAVGIE